MPTIITVSVTTSDQPMSTSNRGTSRAARTNTSEFAQYASCSQRSRRNRQAAGAMRAGAVALITSPAVTAAVTPDIARPRSPMM